ncbi:MULTISPECIES: SatD family protein [unclassified Methanoculleus]|jgi:hypothetical protein|uniref:SatD family (SatD) n=1 Tax=Methanoculleus formosensis TaxID=2590886 RepID=A0A9E5DEZ0_9EURY|nr:MULTISPECIES: SatD family protein [unclassified Methanoculleus]MCK9318402.1 SatD family protein [Methanoculleus sp.]MCT8336641.1 hypothetical protein [Methanoculleus sp. Afa-1]MDD2254442.1 SatD family protein [Methanoculleus sp.]MDD2786757.1 SatD family protein [Methanoculleus sp.]MDD3216880.1 SatD family protein [Methanoculleus sp.]
MTERKIYAVLTGDLVRSRDIKSAYGEECIRRLKDTLGDIGKDYIAPFSIFRGDSFQGVSSNPEEALEDAVLLRLKLIAGFDRDNSALRMDARIAVGIGTARHLPADGSAGEGDGEAFRLSGLELDGMKEAGRGIIVKTPWASVNTTLSIFCSVLDMMIDGYTKRQAEAVMLALEGLTQKEIGGRVGTSQSAVSYRLRGTGYDVILKIIEWYRLQVRERIEPAEKIGA